MTDKINQELEILQQVIKAGMKDSEHSGINVVYIGQVRIGTQEMENVNPNNELAIPLASTQPQSLKLPDLKNLVLEKGKYEKLGEILEHLPEPRFNSLLKAICIAALNRNKTQKSASDWLGIGEGTFHNWLTKFSLRYRDRRNV